LLDDAIETSSPISGVPAWYLTAVRDIPRRGTVEVAGATIATREWGPRSGPTVVLVHGGSAHAGWWDHIAPALALHARVVAFDSSGHGDSTWRPEYTVRGWADELVEVVDRVAPEGPVTLVGHSRGGIVATLAGPRIPALGQLVVVEAAFDVAPIRPADVKAHRVYPSREAAVARFRTLPHEERLEFLIPHIAEQSVRAVDGGWTWKFDPGIQGKPSLGPDDIVPMPVPTLLLRGEHGLASAETMEQVRRRLGGGATLTTIPHAGHHVMLSHPVELIEELSRHVPR